MHPDDNRYREFVGKYAKLPIVNRKIIIVADDHAKMDQGSGAVKITPAHDFNDYEVGMRHNLEIINIFNEKAELNENCPNEYQGLDEFQAREKIINELKILGALNKVEKTFTLFHTVIGQVKLLNHGLQTNGL